MWMTFEQAFYFVYVFGIVLVRHLKWRIGAIVVFLTYNFNKKYEYIL